MIFPDGGRYHIPTARLCSPVQVQYRTTVANPCSIVAEVQSHMMVVLLQEKVSFLCVVISCEVGWDVTVLCTSVSRLR